VWPAGHTGKKCLQANFNAQQTSNLSQMICFFALHSMHADIHMHKREKYYGWYPKESFYVDLWRPLPIITNK